MKKLFTLLFISCLLSLTANAQEQSFKFKSTGTKFRLESYDLAYEGSITIEPAVSHTDGETTTENINTIEVEKSYNILADTEYTVLGNFTKLNLRFNEISDLDLSDLTNLETLYCDINQISDLDLSNLVKLQTLYCGNNQLSNLDLSGLTNLKTLRCSVNKLSSLDLSNLTNLETLGCAYTQLSSLDLSNLTNLERLECAYTQLSSLELSNLTNLVWIQCPFNQLSSLNLSNLTNLIYLDCEYNQISDLELSNVANLQELRCKSNQLIDIKGIKGFSGIRYPWEGSNQSLTIAMKPNGANGFISVNEYSLETGHILSIELPEGTSFKNGRFISTAGFPSEEIEFSTTIGLGDETKLEGRLKFFEAAAIVNGKISLEGTSEGLKAKQFEFRLYKKNETTIFASARNDAAGDFKFIFGTPQEVGLSTYILKQHNNKQKNYTYDTKEYTVELTVELKTRNTLESTVVIKDGETIVPIAEFTNIYTAPSGINQFHTASQIKVYPNPLKDNLYIEAAEQMIAVSLYDISGKLLIKEKVEAKSFVLPSAELNTGVYILRVQTLNGFKTIKLIKK